MRSAYRWAIGLLVPLLAACPGKDGRSTEPAPCREAYAQCKLPDGPLGVCNEVPCAENQRPPCLRCISQH
jgi:hypothetical protein